MRKELEKALDDMRANGEMWETAQAEMARLMFASYTNFISAGFTETQALELTKLYLPRSEAKDSGD